jgi:mannose-6-phosphate isomerase-like protein (cupin superfamily)
MRHKAALPLLTLLLASPAFPQASAPAPAAAAPAAERTVDPTFLRRHVSDVAERRVAISSPTAHYRPLFGEGDEGSSTLKGVTRYGELRVDRGGSSALVSYPREEHILVILEGTGSVSYAGANHALRAEDYVYLPAGVEFGLKAAGAGGVRAILMGFKIPEGMEMHVPASIQMANFNDVELQVVGGHPRSTLYRLLMGDTTSTRDKLSTGHLMISLFIMEFQPGGTNFPHHHETQEEIYLLLDGTGEMVAGGGSDGVEGKFAARPGDAYYYRPNTTVGFYNSSAPSPRPARILAVRNNLPPRPPR